MKLSLLLFLVLVCLALLAFDEGDAFRRRSKHKGLRLRRLRASKKSSRRRVHKKHTRGKFSKRRRRSSSKKSSSKGGDFSRLHAKLEKWEKKLDRMKGNCKCHKGAHGKNQGLEHMCADGTHPTYSEDDSQFACCRSEQDIRHGACVDTSCGIKTTLVGSSDGSGDVSATVIRVEDFHLNGSVFDGFIGATPVTSADDLFFSCTREGCCELAGEEGGQFDGTITAYITQPTPGCNIFIDAECKPRDDVSNSGDCPCSGSFGFTDETHVFSFTFTGDVGSGGVGAAPT